MLGQRGLDAGGDFAEVIPEFHGERNQCKNIDGDGEDADLDAFFAGYAGDVRTRGPQGKAEAGDQGEISGESRVEEKCSALGRKDEEAQRSDGEQEVAGLAQEVAGCAKAGPD